MCILCYLYMWHVLPTFSWFLTLNSVTWHVKEWNVSGNFLCFIFKFIECCITLGRFWIDSQPQDWLCWQVICCFLILQMPRWCLRIGSDCFRYSFQLFTNHPAIWCFTVLKSPWINKNKYIKWNCSQCFRVLFFRQ